MPKLKRKPKKSVPVTNEFHCCDQSFQHSDFIDHMISTHGYIKGTMCVRSLLAAVDCTTYYSNTYEWQVPCNGKTINVQQVCRGPRSRSSMFGE